MKKTSFWIKIAAIYGFLGVAMGAFGAHGLKDKLPSDLFSVFETGSQYCLVHAVVLLAVASLSKSKPNVYINRGGWFFTVGIAIFSGTLWMLAITGQRWLGAVTPIGGVSLLLGWGMLFMAGFKQEDKDVE